MPGLDGKPPSGTWRGGKLGAVTLSRGGGGDARGGGTEDTRRKKRGHVGMGKDGERNYFAKPSSTKSALALGESTKQDTMGSSLWPPGAPQKDLE